MSIFRDALTETDGATFALVKLLGMAGVVVFLGLSVAGFVTGKPFDALAYGTGLGLVIAALGAAIRMSDPPKEPPK